MHGQLETIGEQRAQHLQHLVLGRRALDTAFDVETIGVDPVGTADEFLHGPVRKPDDAFERDIEADISTRLCLAAAPLLARRVRFDRRHVEPERALRLLCEEADD